MRKMKDENINPFSKVYWRRWVQSDTVSSTILFPSNLCLFRNDDGIVGLPSSMSLNPGNIANLHKKTRDMMPEWIEGLNLRCAMNLDVHKELCLEWLMGNSVPAGFRVGGIICHKDSDNITSTPAIAGDTNPSTLATNFHFLYHPVPQIKLESKIQTGSFPFTAASGLGNSIGIAEYLGKNSTISLALYSPSRTTGRMTIGFLHSFDSTFCAGAELLTEWQRSAMKYRLAIAARYSLKKSCVAATISKDALDISFWHQPSNLMQLGGSFIWILNSPRPLASFCYQLEMKDSIIKAMIDSDFAVGCTYSRQLKNFPSAIGFSVLFCIPTNKFYCGFKFEVNSNLK